MARIFVTVEGESEETFVNEVLASHLVTFGHFAVARLMGNARLRTRRGGIQGWPLVATDIVRRLTADQTCYVTMMVDYYALPAGGDGAWPGRAEAGALEFARKAPTVTRALSDDIALKMNPAFARERFIPFVMMHEFEGLLFSDCVSFASGIGRPELAPRFQAIRDSFQSPEEINDSALTAPSKRVEELVLGYRKPFMGTVAALEIGLDAIRAECGIFDAWVAVLERLPAEV